MSWTQSGYTYCEFSKRCAGCICPDLAYSNSRAVEFLRLRYNDKLQTENNPEKKKSHKRERNILGESGESGASTSCLW